MFLTASLTLLALLLFIVYRRFILHKACASNIAVSPRPIETQRFLTVLKTVGKNAFHVSLARLKAEYGDLFAFRLGFSRIYIISSVEYARHILSDRATYDISKTVNKSFSLVFPSCLQAIRGDTFKRHAGVMARLYRKNKLMPYFDQIVHCVDHFIEQEFSHQDKRVRTDIVQKCQHLLLNIVCSIGYDYDLEQNSSSAGYKLQQAFNVMISRSGRFDISCTLPMWLARLRLAFDSEFQDAYRLLKHEIMHIIEEEQKRQQENQHDRAKLRTIIASMVAAAESDRLEKGSASATLSPDELFDEVCFSVIAGFETTSTVLSWFLFFMSKHPEVQQRLKEELRHHGISPDVPLTFAAMERLEYVNCTLKETLRYAPLVAGIIRQATCDNVIGDISVKKGDVFVIATQNMHRDPRYWNIDPNRFAPERFLDEDSTPPAYAFMPFGGGHRQCIGQELATLMLKTTISRLMQRVTVEDAGLEANNSGGFIQRITCFPKHVAVRVTKD